MRITASLLLTSSRAKRRFKDEPADHYLARLTHISLEERGIVLMEGFDLVPSMQVLYLYSNAISAITGLDLCIGLTALYLQDNQIVDMSGLAGLVRLQKLHLSGNRISVISGLEHCRELTELYMQNQRISGASALALDDASADTLARSLRVINVSNCGIRDPRPFSQLVALESLALADNRIDADFDTLSLALSTLGALRVLTLKGNPVATNRKLRASVILVCPWLESVDGKEVSHTERLFIENWHASKARSSGRVATAPARGGGYGAGSGGGGSGGGLHFEPAVRFSGGTAEAGAADAGPADDGGFDEDDIGADDVYAAMPATAPAPAVGMRAAASAAASPSFRVNYRPSGR